MGLMSDRKPKPPTRPILRDRYELRLDFTGERKLDDDPNAVPIHDHAWLVRIPSEQKRKPKPKGTP